MCRSTTIGEKLLMVVWFIGVGVFGLSFALHGLSDRTALIAGILGVFTAILVWSLRGKKGTRL